MTFKTQMKDDVINCLLNTDELAEQISYTPKGGAARQIKAIVERKRITPSGEDAGRTLINQVEIMIANDAVNGVSSVNKGGDTVSLPERVGGTDISWVVADILEQDEGIWHLLLEK